MNPSGGIKLRSFIKSSYCSLKNIERHEKYVLKKKNQIFMNCMISAAVLTVVALFLYLSDNRSVNGAIVLHLFLIFSALFILCLAFKSRKAEKNMFETIRSVSPANASAGPKPLRYLCRMVCEGKTSHIESAWRKLNRPERVRNSSASKNGL